MKKVMCFLAFAIVVCASISGCSGPESKHHYHTQLETQSLTRLG